MISLRCQLSVQLIIFVTKLTMGMIVMTYVVSGVIASCCRFFFTASVVV